MKNHSLMWVLCLVSALVLNACMTRPSVQPCADIRVNPTVTFAGVKREYKGFLCTLSDRGSTDTLNTSLVSGVVLSAVTAQGIPSVLEIQKDLRIATDSVGRFQVRLPRGEYRLIVSSLGHTRTEFSVLPITAKRAIEIKIVLGATQWVN
jgi:hypothetical protein